MLKYIILSLVICVTALGMGIVIKYKPCLLTHVGFEVIVCRGCGTTNPPLTSHCKRCGLCL